MKELIIGNTSGYVSNHPSVVYKGGALTNTQEKALYYQDRSFFNHADATNNGVPKGSLYLLGNPNEFGLPVGTIIENQ